jgi:hypothetical protein
LPIEIKTKQHVNANIAVAEAQRTPPIDNDARKQRRPAAALTRRNTCRRPNPHTSSGPHTTLSPKPLAILLAIADGSADERATAHI